MLEIPETTAISEQVASFLSGRTIVKEAHLGGAVYYCPVCQPLAKNRREPPGCPVFPYLCIDLKSERPDFRP